MLDSAVFCPHGHLNNCTSAEVNMFFTQIAAVVMTISRNKATDDENQILTMSAAA